MQIKNIVLDGVYVNGQLVREVININYKQNTVLFQNFSLSTGIGYESGECTIDQMAQWAVREAIQKESLKLNRKELEEKEGRIFDEKVNQVMNLCGLTNQKEAVMLILATYAV